MLDGKMWALPVTQGLLVGTSMFIAIPSIMVFLSLVLRPGLNRWANMLLGVIYTAGFGRPPRSNRKDRTLSRDGRYRSRRKGNLCVPSHICVPPHLHCGTTHKLRFSLFMDAQVAIITTLRLLMATACSRTRRLRRISLSSAFIVESSV